MAVGMELTAAPYDGGGVVRKRGFGAHTCANRERRSVSEPSGLADFCEPRGSEYGVNIRFQKLLRSKSPPTKQAYDENRATPSTLVLQPNRPLKKSSFSSSWAAPYTAITNHSKLSILFLSLNFIWKLP
jgi:hypothetical protein